jgi:hypothetical protein
MGWLVQSLRCPGSIGCADEEVHSERGLLRFGPPEHASSRDRAGARPPLPELPPGGAKREPNAGPDSTHRPRGTEGSARVSGCFPLHLLSNPSPGTRNRRATMRIEEGVWTPSNATGGTREFESSARRPGRDARSVGGFALWPTSKRGLCGDETSTCRNDYLT